MGPDPSHAPSGATMSAAVLRAPGAPVLGVFPVPVQRDGAVVVEVAAAGLNPVDLLLASGAFRIGPPVFPSVPGEEGAGRAPDGRRVYFGSTVAPYGSMAQRTLVDPGQLFDLPDDVDDATAVGLGIAGLAGWLGLGWRAALQPGETVVVLGATGAVGRIAVQAARLQGAGRVVAAGRDARGLARALELGADATVDLTRSGDDLAEAFREAAAGDVHLVVDTLWGSSAIAALHAGGAHVRLVQIGDAASTEARIPSSLVRMKDVTIFGYSSFTTPTDVAREAYGELLRHAAAGRLVVDLDRRPLREVEQAWAAQEAGTHEKIVLVS